MITFSHVNKEYPNGTKALRDAHFKVERGEFVLLTGPNGSGKSTVLKLIYMAERPDAGEVFVSLGGESTFRSRDASPARAQRLRRHLGIVFQDFKLLFDRDVFENVAFPLRIAGHSPPRIKRRVYEALALTGMTHKAKTQPRRLSGGEQQRVAIARAVAHEPHIVLADEPTANLDPATSREIVRIFQNINAAGAVVLMATHDDDLIASLPYRRLALNGGALVDREPN